MTAELAALALKAGQIDDAEARARESLVIAERIGDRPGRVFGVGLFAGIAAERGQHDRARQLWSVVAHEHAGAPLGGWPRHRADVEAVLMNHLGASPPCSAATERMRLDDAVRLALQ
jgi:hypothetical protein